MALPCVTRVLLAQRLHIGRTISESTRSLSVGGVCRGTRPLPCQNPESLEALATHISAHRRSPEYYAHSSGKHEHTHSQDSHWTSAVFGAVAFSFFSSAEEDTRTEAQKKEDEIILFLKKAKLSMYRGQLHAASGFLHQAIALAHQTHNTKAIIYTYSLMANLAYVQGQLDNAEKLFKAAMSFMLSGGTPQDDNGIIEISLKLATIYAGQDKTELAEHGYQFCTESLEAKLEKLKEPPAEEESVELREELRKETRLLLGLCLDSHARYMASTKRLKQATKDYQSALQICHEEQGEMHPQTLVLMSDLATILDLQGRQEEALPVVKKAVELSRVAGHPDQHVLLCNMAGILMHQGQLEQSVCLYKEALSLAQSVGDSEAVEQIQEGLKEVAQKKKERKAASSEAEVSEVPHAPTNPHAKDM